MSVRHSFANKKTPVLPSAISPHSVTLFISSPHDDSVLMAILFLGIDTIWKYAALPMLRIN
jgi:hypothetical protein